MSIATTSHAEGGESSRGDAEDAEREQEELTRRRRGIRDAIIDEDVDAF
jgi:hypothetical protein